MVNGLISAKMNYFRTLDSDPLVVDIALENNHKYYEKLYELRTGLKAPEDKFELAQELIYLSEQAFILKNIQLNYGGEENE